jgi:predicted PurR-regulated permease PerM
MLLRFIPYIGPIIAAALPMIVALAVDPGWSMLWTMGLFVVVAYHRAGD